MDRATRRPANVRPPARWGASPPVPAPALVEPDAQEREHGPTRYGDWESKGIAIDF